MNLTCLPSIRLFDSPEFLTYSLKCITVISTPIHIIGLYCIIRKTPIEMKNAKWYLLNYHIWMVLFDYSVSFLTIPVLLFPAFAGYPLGFLRAFGFPAVCQTLLVLLFLGYVIASIIFIFENRFYTICMFARHSFWRWLRHVWLAAHYVGIAILLAPFGFLIADQTTAKHKIFQSLPCLPRYMYDADVIVIADEDTYLYPLSMCILLVLLAFGEIGICILFLMYNTAKQLLAKAMSERTFGMQKKFFIGIVIQISVPLIMFCIPFLYALISVLSNYYNQSLTNFAIIIASLQSSAATVVMVFVHRPYRRAILSRCFKKNSPLIQDTRIGQKTKVFTVVP